MYGEGDTNSRIRSGFQSKRKLQIDFYQVRTLLSDATFIELKKELKIIKWNLIGLSGGRRKEREQQIIKESGNLLHYNGEETTLKGGVWFSINKKYVSNIIEVTVNLSYIFNTQTERTI